ncbi:GHMP kinase [Lusitaniella coriacea LEGE 07157]|uniref:GHMP kinase n=1 Tax=Lusitaniella coriacea LEGE 07157 TaxID=945747 RepID=A0A8J7J3U7_9CYAN|nr:GHMP kinase [Lusitaniella coriacea]MBE9117184.1 GHMP kinase [Lusitaniella coriacea LEGE 07157]
MLISRTPVRISFLGGGTDYPEYFLQHGGAVLVTAIDKFCYVTVSPFLSHLFEYSARVSYRKVELVKKVDEIEHNVYRECLKLCGLEKDIEVHNVADLPAFTGLGSSSTFTVSLLHALHSFKGEFVRPLDLAYEAIHVERNILKDRVGCQDQTIAAVGGFNVLEFRTEEDIVVTRIPISPERLVEFEKHIFVVFTGIRRKASEVVAKQLKKVADNTETLKQMRLMVDEGWEILTGNHSLSEFGELLHRAWIAKRSLEVGVSKPEIDRIYQLGLDAGAWGGKLLGAGAGGFMLFFAPPEVHPRLKQVFADRQVLEVNLNAPGSQIIFS